jgi:hypothetical protein
MCGQTKDAISAQYIYERNGFVQAQFYWYILCFEDTFVVSKKYKGYPTNIPPSEAKNGTKKTAKTIRDSRCPVLQDTLPSRITSAFSPYLSIQIQ